MDMRMHVETVGVQHEGLTLLFELSAMCVASLALLGPKWQQNRPESLEPHIACSMLRKKPPRRRAEALKPSMSCWLQIVCFTLLDAYDKVIARMRMLCSNVNRIRHAGFLGRFG